MKGGKKLDTRRAHMQMHWSGQEEKEHSKKMNAARKKLY